MLFLTEKKYIFFYNLRRLLVCVGEKKEMRGKGQIFLERTIGAGDTVAVSKADNLRKVKTQKKGELEGVCALFLRLTHSNVYE